MTLHRIFHCSLIFRLATIITVVGVGYFSIVPMEETPMPAVWDKAQHFFAYFVIACGVYFSRIGLQLRYVVSMTVLYSISVECAQYFVLFRTFSFNDMLANSIGAIVGGGASCRFDYVLTKIAKPH